MRERGDGGGGVEVRQRDRKIERRQREKRGGREIAKELLVGTL